MKLNMKYCTKIYRKHQNNIDKVWNKDVYPELIEKEMQRKCHAIHGLITFPMDSDICIERKIVPMKYHVITKKRSGKTFEDGKKEQIK